MNNALDRGLKAADRKQAVATASPNQFRDQAGKGHPPLVVHHHPRQCG